ncbi:type II toxin-antitoxin system VapC family toxin [Pararhizobium sp.]|uniref:type II toxin-antitoxin system VapC family toxin n=1 Tax=Pararhizobium sp. TaxID=1977563 RepID=UPI00271BBC03|nr:type II toxin-antitoxin system VapC family toxin [Pararhizobium sp.]MDO9415960.1 type II toxin-antitoxin system VapC family toxin [Pararhizobium sp.]
MRLLLDTHLLIWAANEPENLSAEAIEFITNRQNTLMFSVASLWEVAIKQKLQRSDFYVDPSVLRRGLLETGYEELTITAQHAIAVAELPVFHKDPFDRILVAQAWVEGILFLTGDRHLMSYPGSIRLV